MCAQLNMCAWMLQGLSLTSGGDPRLRSHASPTSHPRPSNKHVFNITANSAVSGRSLHHLMSGERD
jgi:hypothetical protein